MAGCRERDELSGSIKDVKFFEWLSDCSVLKIDPVPWQGRVRRACFASGCVTDLVLLLVGQFCCIYQQRFFGKCRPLKVEKRKHFSI